MLIWGSHFLQDPAYGSRYIMVSTNVGTAPVVTLANSASSTGSILSATSGFSANVTIDYIDSLDYAVVKPLSVTVDVEDGCYTATHPATGIAISGDSLSEALSLLREHITELYAIYSAERKLGPEPARQMKILETHIAKRRRRENRAA